MTPDILIIDHTNSRKFKLLEGFAVFFPPITKLIGSYPPYTCSQAKKSDNAADEWANENGTHLPLGSHHTSLFRLLRWRGDLLCVNEG